MVSPRVDALLPQVAAELGLRVIAPLAGGEFGATLVSDTSGRELVLKALPGEAWAPQFARAAELVETLRSRGYPAPEYRGTGVAAGASWSLQERLPGTVPDVMTEAHARRVLELVAMHAGAAPPHLIADAPAPGHDGWLRTVSARADCTSIAAELVLVLERTSKVVFLGGGIVHGDFHHRNYLATADEVTGVFDWEFASTGDWRADLVNLAFWSALLPGQIPPPVARLIIDRMFAACPHDVRARFVALMTLRQLDFDARVHPERLVRFIPGLQSTIAPWWRAVL